MRAHIFVSILQVKGLQCMEVKWPLNFRWADFQSLNPAFFKQYHAALTVTFSAWNVRTDLRSIHKFVLYERE